MLLLNIMAGAALAVVIIFPVGWLVSTISFVIWNYRERKKYAAKFDAATERACQHLKN